LNRFLFYINISIESEGRANMKGDFQVGANVGLPEKKN
jgi:hypothetical protein